MQPPLSIVLSTCLRVNHWEYNTVFFSWTHDLKAKQALTLRPFAYMVRFRHEVWQFVFIIRTKMNLLRRGYLSSSDLRLPRSFPANVSCINYKIWLQFLFASKIVLCSHLKLFFSLIFIYYLLFQLH